MGGASTAAVVASGVADTEVGVGRPAMYGDGDVAGLLDAMWPFMRKWLSIESVESIESRPFTISSMPIASKTLMPSMCPFPSPMPYWL